MIEEQAAVSDVAVKGGGGAVAGLAHDGVLGGTGPSGLGAEAGAE